jgi:phosphoribosylaminoimidazolecarboxamide formyltransferase/IMP cyclohydrolase
MSLYPVSGGLLVQHKDNQTLGELKPVTQRAPNPIETIGLTFAWKVAKHAKSCAMVLAKGTQAIGIGAGQPSRIDALKLAIEKSNERHPILRPQDPLVLASDGPIPLRCLHEAATVGVAAIIQPGGTSEDQASIQLCNQQGVAMAFTGLRHLKH